MDRHRARWEEKHATRDRAHSPPSPFLSSLLPNLGSGRALDLASGDGRHSLLLARHGFRVDAIDFAHNALLRLQRRACAEGLAIRLVQADLERIVLPVETYDLAIQTFYLQRSLWDPLKSCLRRGGIAVVETFTIEQRELGHPRNPDFLLQPRELREVFRDFEILHEEEGLRETSSGNAHVARIAARRKAESAK